MKFASRIELSAGIGTVELAVVSSGFFIIATKSSEVIEGSLHYVGFDSGKTVANNPGKEFEPAD